MVWSAWSAICTYPSLAALLQPHQGRLFKHVGMQLKGCPETPSLSHAPACPQNMTVQCGKSLEHMENREAKVQREATCCEGTRMQEMDVSQERRRKKEVSPSGSGSCMKVSFFFNR